MPIVPSYATQVDAVANATGPPVHQADGVRRRIYAVYLPTHLQGAYYGNWDRLRDLGCQAKGFNPTVAGEKQAREWQADHSHFDAARLALLLPDLP